MPRHLAVTWLHPGSLPDSGGTTTAPVEVCRVIAAHRLGSVRTLLPFPRRNHGSPMLCGKRASKFVAAL